MPALSACITLPGQSVSQSEREREREKEGGREKGREGERECVCEKEGERVM